MDTYTITQVRKYQVNLLFQIKEHIVYMFPFHWCFFKCVYAFPFISHSFPCSILPQFSRDGANRVSVTLQSRKSRLTANLFAHDMSCQTGSYISSDFCVLVSWCRSSKYFSTLESEQSFLTSFQNVDISISERKGPLLMGTRIGRIYAKHIFTELVNNNDRWKNKQAT